MFNDVLGMVHTTGAGHITLSDGDNKPTNPSSVDLLMKENTRWLSSATMKDDDHHDGHHNANKKFQFVFFSHFLSFSVSLFPPLFPSSFFQNGPKWICLLCVVSFCSKITPKRLDSGCSGDGSVYDFHCSGKMMKWKFRLLRISIFCLKRNK